MDWSSRRSRDALRVRFNSVSAPLGALDGIARDGSAEPWAQIAETRMLASRPKSLVASSVGASALLGHG